MEKIHSATIHWHVFNLAKLVFITLMLSQLPCLLLRSWPVHVNFQHSWREVFPHLHFEHPFKGMIHNGQKAPHTRARVEACGLNTGQFRQLSTTSRHQKAASCQLAHCPQVHMLGEFLSCPQTTAMEVLLYILSWSLFMVSTPKLEGAEVCWYSGY